MWVATMETESYSWVALGNTEEEALKAIKKEWDKSPRRKPMKIKELDEWYGIHTFQLNAGECMVE